MTAKKSAVSMAASIVSSERAMTLSEASKWIARQAGSRSPHVSTLIRWIERGVRGVRLGAWRVGSKYWTTADCLAEFLDALNTKPDERQAANASNATATFQQRVRQKQVDDACAQLDSLCQGWDSRQSDQGKAINPSCAEDQLGGGHAAGRERSNLGSK